MKISKDFHTDSTTVLRYIMNDQKRFQVFVANRVQTIRTLSHPSQWMYVETRSNPADDASRGINASALLEHSRWIKGPEYPRLLCGRPGFDSLPGSQDVRGKTLRFSQDGQPH